MVLIALLIALSVERLYHSPGFLHWSFYLERWQGWSAERLKDEKWESGPLQLVRMLVPAVAIGLLVVLLDNLMVTFIVSILALLLAINCEPARKEYKAYLKAANRGDEQQVSAHQQALTEFAGRHQPEQLSDSLIWINYRQYIAVMFYFVLFGSFGALVYATLRYAEKDTKPRQQLLWFADWVPARLSAFGLLIVGHFSRAFPTWLQQSLNPQTDPDKLLFEVAGKAEDSPQHPDDRTEHIACQLRLMRRQQVFWIVVIAALTVWGAVS
ncbi:beta-lactamase regulator AmpE [Idiomarina sp. HP20-50]|uniref:beta-lactamase regulator AmpE n=1 Tax=Idiomarina sp. HP20-50 TaxID=3070813 RepID=UPI00294AE603|nr:beta-lactamase regulator AmpE [Idiomarina sp. HP20-50]MDV6316028.1 beta-lactamase regulator AmpE [Idiomarina sp. HP20-50]